MSDRLTQLVIAIAPDVVKQYITGESFYLYDADLDKRVADRIVSFAKLLDQRIADEELKEL